MGRALSVLNMTDDLGFIHRFIPAADNNQPTLLLLHGTGGDENDLLPLAQRIAPGAGILSPRGKDVERGLVRYSAARRRCVGSRRSQTSHRRTG